MTEPGSVSGEHRLLRYRVGQLEASQTEFRAAIKSIDTSLQSLADVQRRLGDLGDVEARLRAIEQELPTLKLVRKWVLAAASASVVAAGGTAASMLGLFR